MLFQNIPKMGMIIPNMGMPKRQSIADALFPAVHQRVLGLLFGQPNRVFPSAELIRSAEGGIGAVHRYVTRLAKAELISVTTVGNQRHYQANRESPVFEDLHGLAVKTVGLVEPLKRALRRFKNRISAAFVYGSIAKGTDRSSSDIDLMIISDHLSYPDLFDAVHRAEVILSRPISPRVMRQGEWQMKRKQRGSFAWRVAAGPKLYVLGSDDDI